MGVYDRGHLSVYHIWENMTGSPISMSHMGEYDRGHLSVYHIWENMTGSPISISHMGEYDRVTYQYVTYGRI